MSNLQRIAKTTKVCSWCLGSGEHPLGHSCTNCNGTGRVPLVPGLLVKCSCIHVVIPVEGDTRWARFASCKEVGCSGWTVTTDAETIARSLWPLLVTHTVHTLYRDTYMETYTWRYERAMASGHFAEAWEAAAHALEEVGLIEKETP